MSNRAAHQKRSLRRLEREARCLAKAAEGFLAGVPYGGPYSRDAEHLSRQALRLLQCAARFDAVEEIEEKEND